MDGLYVHIPFCASKCAYCNFCSSVENAQTQDGYVTRLLEEMAARAGEVDTVETVYIGGGTPGVLSERNLGRIVEGIHRFFHLSADTEMTIETNPNTVEGKKAVIRDGFNRVSLGLQSASDRLTRAVCRTHTFADFCRAVECLTGAGITNISADLMLGLPGQTETDVCETLEDLKDLPLKHLSVYGLKVEENTPLYRSGFVTDDDLQAEFYEVVTAVLKKRGFNRYETSNFSLQGYECRHNMKYWTLAPYLGVGVAAHSDTRGRRSYNTDSLADYMQGASAVVTDVTARQREEEYVMLGLRLEKGIDARDYALRFGHEFSTGRADALDRLLRQKVLISDGNNVRIAPKYVYVANAVIVKLMFS